MVDPQEIKNLDADMVVCADGSHSRSRQHLAESEAQLPLQHLVQMTYEVAGKSKRLSAFRKYPAMKAVGYLVDESTTYDKTTHKTTVNVLFFVNEADYNQLISDENNRPNFRNPLDNIESELLTGQLKGAMHLWLNYRQERGEGPAESIKITPIGLSIYQSPQFSFDLGNEKRAAVVGDAASGVPFRRSLNKGVQESSLCAKTIVKSTDYPKEKKQYFKRYDQKMRRIARRETGIALSKNLGLNIIDLFTRISGLVPWQTNKIQSARRELLKNNPPKIRSVA